MSINGEAAAKLIEDTLDGEHSVPGEGFGKEHAHLLAGIGYALLDVADAVREQTAALATGEVTVTTR
jgi:hypothetical protein